MSNIWVAAGDGDLPRVQHLVETQSTNVLASMTYRLIDDIGISPNQPDAHTYTPMHAAASYGHLHVLTYLISKGGDVNVTDHDGDTPLYAVENIQTARFLIDNGASLQITNNEGISPIDHLSEDFPAVAAYLQTRLPSSLPPSSNLPISPSQTVSQSSFPSQHAQHVASESLTTELIESVQSILQQAQSNDTMDTPEVDEALTAAVTRSVLRGMTVGLEYSAQQQQQQAGDEQVGEARSADQNMQDDPSDTKRSKTGE
ncbi:hypothetical protein EYR36_008649 [Pleurotus pulmonarius]|nr:hypothetical protein EYR36_008649 [Pleurotus pulmonarius]